MTPSKEPKLYQHLRSLYKVLSDEAGADGVWEGSQAKAFTKLKLSSTYNSILFRGLRELGCVEVLQQGHGPKPSRLRLIESPQIDSFRKWSSHRAGLTSAVTLRNIEARLAAVERRLPQGVTLADWIVGIEERLSAVEKERDGKSKKSGSS